MKLIAAVLSVLMVAGTLSAAEANLTINPERSVIVSESGQNTAAAELKTHLDLITGKTIPMVKPDQIKSGSYVFYVGRAPAGSEGKYQPEEARWQVTPKAAYFYGDTNKGTLHAVYDFLENELGVRWPAPEDIAFQPQGKIEIRNRQGCWIPTLNIRQIRGYKDRAVNQWHARLRYGNHDAPRYGHAFTKYWNRFSKTHPEYFAMRKDGVRAPVGAKVNSANAAAFRGKQSEAIAMCVSSEGLIRQVIADWKKAGCPLYINLCENDADGKDSCHCPKCTALDVVPEKRNNQWQNWYADRYIHFANRVLAEAKKIRPDVKASMYAYDATEQAPAREKPAADIVIGIVPTDFSMAGIEAYVGSWKKAGLNHFFYRPNRHVYYSLPYLPVGWEKHFFEIWKYLYRSGAIGFDYDAGSPGTFQCFSDYVVMKAMQDPSKPFEHWEKHFMQSFGKAADDLENYYRYWREQVWEKRIAPHQAEIAEQGKVFNFSRGLIWNLGKYYKDSDFAETGKHLEKALSRQLTPQERARIEKLKFAHEHARLFFRAVAHKTDRDALNLLDFRKQHKINPLPWNEQYFGDVCGIKRVMNFKEYKPPYLKTPLFWYFRLDPENKGVTEKWYENTPEQVRKWGALMCTNAPWETPHKHYKQVSAEIRKKTVGYDGIAWYGTQIRIPADWKDRKVFLYFGAVDESCWVYLNGKEIVSRIFKNPNDWSTPFALEITSGIDWNRKVQNVIIRVEDTNGQGGIWKPVWLVSK